MIPHTSALSRSLVARAVYDRCLFVNAGGFGILLNRPSESLNRAVGRKVFHREFAAVEVMDSVPSEAAMMVFQSQSRYISLCRVRAAPLLGLDEAARPASERAIWREF